MIYCNKRALFITAVSQAASFRPNHLPIHTSAIPQQNIPTPISGSHHCKCWVIMMAVSTNTEKRQSPSHSDINILTNLNVVKRPTNITRPFLISKRPRKNGFQELPMKGITLCRETRVSFTEPIARWRVNAENTESEVAFFRRSMDSSSPNELSNSALVEPYSRFDNQFICKPGFVKSVGGQATASCYVAMPQFSPEAPSPLFAFSATPPKDRAASGDAAKNRLPC